MIGFNPGGSVSGFGPGSGVSGFGGPTSIFKRGGNSFFDAFKGFGDFLGSKGGQGILDAASLGLGAFGLNKSLGFQEDQLDILQNQQANANKAQGLQTQNSLSLALQTTTPGTPEHEQIKQAIAEGTFATV